MSVSEVLLAASFSIVFLCMLTGFITHELYEYIVRYECVQFNSRDIYKLKPSSGRCTWNYAALKPFGIMDHGTIVKLPCMNILH